MDIKNLKEAKVGDVLYQIAQNYHVYPFITIIKITVIERNDIFVRVEKILDKNNSWEDQVFLNDVGEIAYPNKLEVRKEIKRMAKEIYKCAKYDYINSIKGYIKAKIELWKEKWLNN